jgi:hypothetical protein
MQDAVARRFPYYARVPKEPRANLLWRIAVCRRAMHDAEFRADIVQMCREDPLFFIAGFLWVHEPRKREDAKSRAKTLLFIPWGDQEEAAVVMIDAWGVRDVVVLKSREQGFTWLVLALGLHSWLFEEGFGMGLISKDEPSVDTRGKLGTLMPKLDWLLRKLPDWLLPKSKPYGERKELVLINPDNSAGFFGFSATADAGSGDRLTVFFMDEQAKFPRPADEQVQDATLAVTNCRIMGSSPKGAAGAFYKKATDGVTTKVIMAWENNPTQNRGLYRVTKDGEIQVVDPENNPIDPAYLARIHQVHADLEKLGFTVLDTTRSEWFNTICLRSNPVSIAQEYGRSFGRSTEEAFEHKTIEKLLLWKREPDRVGRILLRENAEVDSFQRMNGGLCKLWFPGEPPKRGYGAGIDVAFGTGGDNSNNSALIIGDLVTGEQLFEFASSAMRIPDFAKLCVAVCKWFWNATMNWDAKGPPGVMFTDEVVNRLEYYNWIESEVESSGRLRQRVRKPGTFINSDDDKASLLQQAIEDGLAGSLVLRSGLTIMEFGEFGYKGGKIVHRRAVQATVESAGGKSHGDRATAAAMFNVLRRQLSLTAEPTPERPPTGDWRTSPVVSWSCPANRLKANLRRNDRTETGPYANRP